MSYRAASAILLSIMTVAVAGCSGDVASPDASPNESPGDGGLRKVTLQLNWYPEAEHGGFYTALENGYYEDAGLDVEIIAGGADVPVVARVAAGQADFGIENADRILLMRAQEADVVAVMAPLQTSPRCLIVHESAGVESFDELGGFTIAMNAGEPYAQFLLAETLPKDVRVVPYTGGVSHFLRNKKHTQQGYNFSEPFVAKEQGGDPHVLLVADAGFNPYTSCLLTHGETIKNDPELVRAMVTSSVRGWKEYLKNPAPTNEAIHQLNPEMSLEILAFGAETMQPLCNPPGEEDQPFGRMSLARWETLANQMTDTGVLDDDAPKPATAFDTGFLSADGIEH